MTHPAWGAPHPEGQLQSILEAHVKGGRYVGSGMARFVLGCTLTKRTAQEGADMHSRQERLQCYVRGAAECCAGYAATKLACLDEYRAITEQNQWVSRNGTATHFWRFDEQTAPAQPRAQLRGHCNVTLPGGEGRQ